MAHEASNTIIINVSGSKFDISKKILSAYPDTRLGKIVNSFESLGHNELRFDRPLASFESILAFYQTGKLHSPPNVCPLAFKEELDYWEIDEDNLEKCCLFPYIKFVDIHKSKTEFHDEQIMDCPTYENPSTRQRLWKIVDFQENTWISKMFLFIGLLFVLTSVITLAVGSLPQFRRRPSACEWSKYISSSGNKENYKEVEELFEKHNCHQMSINSDDDIYYFQYYDYHDYGNFSSYDYDNFTNDWNVTYDFIDTDLGQGKLNTSLFGITFKSDIFLKIDYITLVYFTLELLVRLLVCPGLIWYYKNFVNVLDSLILLGTYGDLIILNLNLVYKFSPKLMNSIDVIKLLRVVRLWRYCQHLTIVRVLKFSIKHNLKDLFVLLLYIVSVVMLCANVLFLSEMRNDVNSIPEGWWLAFVTMTTVGFGDLTPKSVLGKIACGCCALCGILTLAIVVPIFVETFTSVYCIASIGRLQHKKKSEKVQKNAEKIV